VTSRYVENRIPAGPPPTIVGKITGPAVRGDSQTNPFGLIQNQRLKQKSLVRTIV
jgi:hypothetical protein